MPAYNVVDEAEIAKVTEYVRNGGTLVTTFRSGQRNRENNIASTTLPCAFAELAGIEVEEFDPLRKTTEITGLVKSEAKIWCDIIKPITAKALCAYSNRWFAGRAAITVNSFGKGKVYYVGCDLTEPAQKELVRYISEQAGISPIDAQRGIEIIKREDFTILMNHNDYEETAPVTGTSLITGEKFDGKMRPYGVEFIK